MNRDITLIANYKKAKNEKVKGTSTTELYKEMYTKL